MKLLVSTTIHVLHEDIHTLAQPKHVEQSGLLVNVEVRKGWAVIQLLASEDRTLQVVDLLHLPGGYRRNGETSPETKHSAQEAR